MKEAKIPSISFLPSRPLFLINIHILKSGGVGVAIASEKAST
jgi:hypothetical protein